jgi:hypothetical protein
MDYIVNKLSGGFQKYRLIQKDKKISGIKEIKVCISRK